LADSVAAAEEGCRLVDISYEILPAVFDPEEAMAVGAPAADSADPFRARPERNILRSCTVRSATRQRDSRGRFVHDGTYFTPRVQTPIWRTHVVVAWMQDGGCTCAPFAVTVDRQGEAGAPFDLRPDNCGCSANGSARLPAAKQEVITEDLAALAALDTGRSGLSGVHPHQESPRLLPPPDKITVKLGPRPTGTLTAFGFRKKISNTGAYGKPRR